MKCVDHWSSNPAEQVKEGKSMCVVRGSSGRAAAVNRVSAEEDVTIHRARSFVRRTPEARRRG